MLKRGDVCKLNTRFYREKTVGKLSGVTEYTYLLLEDPAMTETPGIIKCLVICSETKQHIGVVKLIYLEKKYE